MSLCFSKVCLGWKKRKRENEVCLKFVLDKGSEFFVNF